MVNIYFNARTIFNWLSKINENLSNSKENAEDNLLADLQNKMDSKIMNFVNQDFEHKLKDAQSFILNKYKEMNEDFTLNNGWKVYSKDNHYFIDVKAIENSIFNKSKTVQIPQEVFDTVKNGETDEKVLFKEYKIHNLILEWKEPKKKTMSKESDEKHFGGGWFVERKDGTYFLDYMAAKQGGESIRQKISKDAFEDAKSGDMDLKALREKYNLK